MHTIEIANNQSLLDVDEAFLLDVARDTLQAEQVAAAEISIALVDDAAIHEVNRRHLNHDYPTDVISFLFECEEPDNGPLDGAPRGSGKRLDGEIVVSTETAIRKAEECGWSPHDELVLYVVHGLLHLAGYDDVNEDERRLMRARERAILGLWQMTPGVES